MSRVSSADNAPPDIMRGHQRVNYLPEDKVLYGAGQINFYIFSYHNEFSQVSQSFWVFQLKKKLEVLQVDDTIDAVD